MCCYIITDNEFSRYSKSVATESEKWADEGIGIWHISSKVGIL